MIKDGYVAQRTQSVLTGLYHNPPDCITIQRTVSKSSGLHQQERTASAEDSIIQAGHDQYHGHNQYTGHNHNVNNNQYTGHNQCTGNFAADIYQRGSLDYLTMIHQINQYDRGGYQNDT